MLGLDFIKAEDLSIFFRILACLNWVLIWTQCDEKLDPNWMEGMVAGRGARAFRAIHKLSIAH